MPRYFFHVLDGQGCHDLEGTELLDINAARVEAVLLAGELINDAAQRFWTIGNWILEVADGRGLLLFSLNFSVDQALIAKTNASLGQAA